MKKALSVLLASLVLVTLALPVSAAENDYGLSYPTKDEIIAKAQALGIDFSAAVEYSEPYSLEAPDYAAGKMTEKSQQDALDLVNLYRYVAGLPSDVQIKESYCELAQAASLVNAANGSLSHTPGRPDGMSDTLYQLGFKGSGQSNLSSGRANINRSTVNGWMDDSSKSNIPMVGHRRWILNPAMQYTGFGSVNRTCAMYSIDESRAGRFTGDYVAWPAPNTPLEMFSGSVFSVTLGSDYDTPSADSVSVTLSSETLQKSWTVNKDNPEQGFYVNNGWYANPKCIIFKVADFNAEDTIRITIDGITKNGIAAPIDYTVDLFNVSEISSAHRYVILRPQRNIVDPKITVSSLLDSAPTVTWSSTDANIADYYPGYGLFSYQEGEATVTASAGGSSVEIPIVSSLSPVLLGDADRDNEVAIYDTTIIQRKLVNMDVKRFSSVTADVDGDGETTVYDATFVQRWLANINTRYPIGEEM